MGRRPAIWRASIRSLVNTADKDTRARTDRNDRVLAKCKASAGKGKLMTKPVWGEDDKPKIVRRCQK